MEKKNKISMGFMIKLFIVCIFFLVVIVLGVNVFINSPKNIVKQDLEGGEISLTYVDDLCGLSISNLSPLTDNNGVKISMDGNYFDFSIDTKLEDAKQIEYEIYIVPDKTSTINSQDIKVYLEKQKSGTYSQVLEPSFITLNNQTSEIGSPIGSMVLYKTTVKESETDNYRLRFWLSEKAQLASEVNNNFSVRVYVKGKAK